MSLSHEKRTMIDKLQVIRTRRNPSSVVVDRSTPVNQRVNDVWPLSKYPLYEPLPPTHPFDPSKRPVRERPLRPLSIIVGKLVRSIRRVGRRVVVLPGHHVHLPLGFRPIKRKSSSPSSYLTLVNRFHVVGWNIISSLVTESISSSQGVPPNEESPCLWEYNRDPSPCPSPDPVRPSPPPPISVQVHPMISWTVFIFHSTLCHLHH